MTSIETVMRLAPVIPVLTIEDAAHARPIAAALVAGGLKAIEVTLRTPAALDAIREIATVEGAVVGAGTVLNPVDLDASVEAGARFIVAPGLTDPLARAARASAIPFLPGVANAGDIMRGLDHGFTHFKFFPAEASGGIEALRALTAPFGAVRFCPTGGIGPATAPDWLGVPSVLCVGGSWIVPPGPPAFDVIEERARAAATLKPRAAGLIQPEAHLSQKPIPVSGVAWPQGRTETKKERA